MSLSRYLAPALLAASLGLVAVAAPAPAQAQSQSDDLVRVLVNAADVVMRGNQPYYRHGHYGDHDRLVARRDRYGRVVYYRIVPRVAYRAPYRPVAVYRTARVDFRPVVAPQRVKCNRHGKCTSTYYEARHQHGHDHDHGSDHDRRRW